MSNSFSSFAEIAKSTYRNDFLINAESFWAHTHVKKASETFYQHNNLVVDYFLQLVNIHGLDHVINNLITKLFNNNVDIQTGNFIKFQFFNAISYHDYGKVNENFQFEKMGNLSAFPQGINNHIGTQHSILSAYIYIVHHFHYASLYSFNNEQKHFINGLNFLFSYPILKHHSPILVSPTKEISFETDTQQYLKKYLPLFNLIINNDLTDKPAKCDSEGEMIVDKNIRSLLIRLTDSFPLFSLLKLNFSLLTASDYLATNQYMNGDENYDTKINDFGVLSRERINEIYKNVTASEWINEAEGKRNYNKAVFEKIDNYQLQYPTDATGDNLNVLRTEMAIEVIRNIRKNKDQNLFYIEAPTGGGKTNLSALAALELLKLHQGKYSKVFYVFPFTTLITQTYKSLKETLFLDDKEMVELHSNAGMKMKENEEDDEYGSEKLNYINHLFINYPFAFLSHIRFFDILKTNEKETNYLLHRLANSIVVIDELQSYNPQHWDKVIYFIEKYAEKFNIKFILMSATLPKLDKLEVIKDQVQDFVYLLPDAKKNYFNNPNFAGRVTFNFDLFESKNLQLQEIADKLLMESESYSNKDFGIAKPLGSVYTIIEFIFKKTATEFYELMKRTDFFDEILLLSGTILPHRRKEIINFLKNKSNRQKKILLVTTQVVEAGVDIDMDLGFKDRSLIDSDEQLAGRINRNVNKEDCTLFLFNYNKEAIIYGNDKRLKLTRDHINLEQYQAILRNKNFDQLYDLVLNDRNEWNNKQMVVGFREYEEKIKSLKYQSVHEEFKLIDQNNLSCFVPISVPVTVNGVVEGYQDEVFTLSELDFLKQFDVYPNERNEIEGEEVFGIYLKLIYNNQERKKEDFAKSKTEDKILQGIISKFVFSLFASPKLEEEIIHFSDEDKSDFGYKYLNINTWVKLFTVKGGLNEKEFKTKDTQFL